METVGIIGFGFLGRAFAHGFYLHADIKIYDKYDNTYDTLEETVHSSKMLFVGVPTPMMDDGSQDLSNIEDAVKSIVDTATDRKIIVLRSTIIPGTTRKIAEKYKGHDFVFHPEFLTERSFKLDFINASRIILGGGYTATTIVKNFYRTRFSHTPIFQTSWEAAEISKYMCNCFFAIKVSFLNEMYKIAEKFNISYPELRDMWLSDQRIGNSHTDVPGHDGHFGYGGKCFPKDVKAFIKWAEDNSMTAEMCKAADIVNDKVRSYKDWENIKGATSQYNYKENDNGNE